MFGNKGGLNIGGATIGYDSSNLQKTFDNLHTSCVSDTKKIMKSKTENIENSVLKAWVGTSADMFKDNWDRDVDYVSKKLDEVSKQLEDQFNTIIKSMNKKEDAIVSKRQGGGR